MELHSFHNNDQLVWMKNMCKIEIFLLSEMYLGSITIDDIPNQEQKIIINHCLDGFECKSLDQCIPRPNVCDGYLDCRDQSDEIYCGKQ